MKTRIRSEMYKYDARNCFINVVTYFAKYVFQQNHIR